MTFLPNIKRKKKVGVQIEYLAIIAIIAILFLQALKSMFTGIFMIFLLLYVGAVIVLMLMPSTNNHGKRFYEQIIIYIKFKVRKWQEVVSKW